MCNSKERCLDPDSPLFQPNYFNIESRMKPNLDSCLKNLNRLTVWGILFSLWGLQFALEQDKSIATPEMREHLSTLYHISFSTFTIL